MNALTEALSKLGSVKKTGNGYSARCPSPTHGGEDRNPSLSIGEGADGRVLIKCFAGCDYNDILAGMELAVSDLFEDDGQPAIPEGEWTPNGPAVAVYDYRDEAGNLLFQVCRSANKGFSQRVPDPIAKSGWKWRLENTRRVPYRLPQIITGISEGRVVYIAEGEKDVHALEKAGQLATCNPGGAGKWLPEFTPHFDGANIVICADKDRPGQAHARLVAELLEPVAASVKIVEAAGEHKDVADHLGAGLTLADLLTTDDGKPAAPVLALGIDEFLDQGDDAYDWIVEDLLERGDRLMLTGFEGFGKTMLIRQLAVCFAAGIHPFNGLHVPPRRVLVIDCENSARQTRRKIRPLRDLARKLGRPCQNDNLRLILRPSGIDLSHAEDAAWLLERVTAHAPDVLFIGPLYRLHAANPNDEVPARRVVAAIDAARIASGCAVIIETHAGHSGRGEERSTRPFGASLWLRWPEFGYGLRPIPQFTAPGDPCEFLPWRGPRDERNWPDYLRWGKGPNDWPWMPTFDPTIRQLAPPPDPWNEESA